MSERLFTAPLLGPAPVPSARALPPTTDKVTEYVFPQHGCACGEQKSLRNQGALRRPLDEAVLTNRETPHDWTVVGRKIVPAPQKCLANPDWGDPPS